MKTLFLILAFTISAAAQISPSGAIPRWSSVTPVSCSASVRSQALLYNWTEAKLYKCVSGSYVELGSGYNGLTWSNDGTQQYFTTSVGADFEQLMFGKRHYSGFGVATTGSSPAFTVFTNGFGTWSSVFYAQFAGTASSATIRSLAAGQIPLELETAPTQSANAFRIKDSGGTRRLYMTGDMASFGGYGYYIRSYYDDTQPSYFTEGGLHLYNSGYGTALTLQANYANTDSRIWSTGLPLKLSQTNDGNGIQIDNNASAGNTRLFVYDVDNGTLERVSVAGPDSCGTGYKCLRILN